MTLRAVVDDVAARAAVRCRGGICAVVHFAPCQPMIRGATHGVAFIATALRAAQAGDFAMAGRTTRRVFGGDRVVRAKR